VSRDPVADRCGYDAAMAHTRSYRFLARPKWIAGHLLLAVTVVGFVNLGFWQLRRHDERSVINTVMSDRLAGPPMALPELISSYGLDDDELEFRRVTARGAYLLAEEVLWQARTLNGRSGHDVLTPLVVGGMAIVVNRGWVPIDATDPPVSGAEPASGSVVVTGVIRRGHGPGGLGPSNPDAGELQRTARVDIDRLQLQIDLDLYPFYIQLDGQQPTQPAGLPIPQLAPSPDAGPHLSYAVQWFVFAAIAAVGYPILVWRTASDEPVEDRRI